MTGLFGLAPESKVYIYEELFNLVQKCGLTYTEAWGMPVEVRGWWMKRKEKEGPQVPGGPDGPPPRR